MIRKLLATDYPLGNLETGYRRQHLVQDIRQSTLVGCIWLLPNFLFAFNDYLLFAEDPLLYSTLGIRLFLLATISLACLILKRVTSPTVYDYLVLITCFLVLSGIFWTNYSRPDMHLYTAGLDYLILFSIYMLVPNRLLFRFLPCFSFSLASIVSYATMPYPPSGSLWVIIGVSFIMTNSLGIWASSRYYAQRRQQYEAQIRAFELRKDLIQNALVDQLTGVSNRRHFFQAAEAEFERFCRYNRSFSVLMIDLDHFKKVNDQYGHPIGDKVLKDLAAIINNCKRDTDILGRLGGEEFALLLPETNLSGATDIAVRLRRACHSVVLPGASSQRITISIGVTQVHSNDSSFDEVLARADETLYRAKNNGRDRVEVA